MSGWDFAASAQMDGSATFASTAANSFFRREESKILPQITHLLADRGVSKFQIVQHSSSLLCPALPARATQSHDNEKSCEYSADPSNPVAITRVKSEIANVVESRQ